MAKRLNATSHTNNTARPERSPKRNGPEITVPSETANEPLFTKQEQTYADCYRWSLTDDERRQWFAFARRYFSRLFRRVVGQAPGDWFIRQKIRRARELLTLPNIRIKDVASRFGYADTLYFSWLFKRIVGIPPEAYHEKLTSGRRKC